MAPAFLSHVCFFLVPQAFGDLVDFCLLRSLHVGQAFLKLTEAQRKAAMQNLLAEALGSWGSRG